ncbi:hypothetical protein OSTOST_15079, partial [Ostertagia ostertagi]
LVRCWTVTKFFHLGGTKWGDRGHYVLPTVLAEVDHRMAIAREEIIGPVKKLIRFESMEDLLKKSSVAQNAPPAAVITKDADNAKHIAQKTSSGSIWVNGESRGKSGTVMDTNKYLDSTSAGRNLFDGDDSPDLLKRLEAQESLPSYIKLLIGVLIETKKEISDLSRLCDSILAENKVLREENESLKSQLNILLPSPGVSASKEFSSSSSQTQNADSSSSKIDPDMSRSIVVSGVPEGQSPNSVDRAQHDLHCVLALLNFLGVECLPPLVFRMGVRNSSRPRLLKVILPNDRFQKEVIRLAPRLRFFPLIRSTSGPSLDFRERNAQTRTSGAIVFKKSLKEAYEILVVNLLILVYRTPLCNAHDSSLLLKVISDFSCYEAPCLLVGDFNLADVDWNSVNCSAGCCAVTKEFVDMFYSHNFVQYVKSPTRGSSYLDLIFCNDVALIGEVEVLPPIGSSDHASAEFTLNVSPPTVTQRKWETLTGLVPSLR